MRFDEHASMQSADESPRAELGGGNKGVGVHENGVMTKWIYIHDRSRLLQNTPLNFRSTLERTHVVFWKMPAKRIASASLST